MENSTNVLQNGEREKEEWHNQRRSMLWKENCIRVWGLTLVKGSNIIARVNSRYDSVIIIFFIMGQSVQSKIDAPGVVDEAIEWIETNLAERFRI